MASVKVRENDGVYDVVFLGLDKTEAMAIREGFSALEVNQDWAFENQGVLTEAVRDNSILAELHQEYKDTIRDVAIGGTDSDEEPEGTVDSEFDDMGFVS